MNAAVQDHQDADDAKDGFQEIPDKDDHLIIPRHAPGTRLLPKDQRDEVHEPQQQPDKADDNNDDGNGPDDGLEFDLVDVEIQRRGKMQLFNRRYHQTKTTRKVPIGPTTSLEKVGPVQARAHLPDETEDETGRSGGR